MAQPPSHTTFSAVRKLVPRELLIDRGTGTDFETRLPSVHGYLTPNDRFYVRSHSSAPQIEQAATLPAGKQQLRGRAYAGEAKVRDVRYRVDDGPWVQAPS